MKNLIIALPILLAACAAPKDSENVPSQREIPAACDTSKELDMRAVSTVAVDARVTSFTTMGQLTLVDCLTTTYKPYSFAPISAVKLLNVKRGDLVMYNASFEVTNDVFTDVMAASVVMAMAPGSIKWYVDEPKPLFLVSTFAGTNVTTAQHHHLIVRSGQFVAQQDYNELELVVFGYAGTDGSKPSALTVERYSSEFSGIVYRAGL